MTDAEWKDLTVGQKLDWLRSQAESLSTRLNCVSFTTFDSDFQTLSEPKRGGRRIRLKRGARC